MLTGKHSGMSSNAFGEFSARSAQTCVQLRRCVCCSLQRDKPGFCAAFGSYELKLAKALHGLHL